MEQICRRVVGFSKSPPSHRADKQSQSSEDEYSFLDASESVPSHPTRNPAEQSQTNNGPLPGPPEISSSPGAHTRGEGPASDDCHQPLELLLTSPAHEASQHPNWTHGSLAFTESSSTSSSIENRRRNQRSIEFHKPTGLTSENVDNAGRLQCTGRRLDEDSESIPSSTALNSFEPSGFENDSLKTDHLPESHQGLDARCDHAFNGGHIQTTSGIVSAPLAHDTLDLFLANGSPAPSKEIGASLKFPDTGREEPHVVESSCELPQELSSLPALGTIDPTFPAPNVDAIDASLAPPDFDTNDTSVVATDIEATGEYVPSTDIDATIPDPPFLDATETSLPAPSRHFNCQFQKQNIHIQPSDLLSSSPGINIPDQTECSGVDPDQTSDFMTISSVPDTDEHLQLTVDLLHRSLELNQSSQNLPTLKQPQPIYGHRCGLAETFATLSDLESGSIDPQFSLNSPPQSLEVMVSSDVGLNYVHSGDEVEVEETAEEEGEEEVDISALEYARQNGLCRDHFNEPYLISKADGFENCQVGLTDDSHLPRFELAANVNTDERLTISKDAALLIDSIARKESSEWVESAMLRMIDTRKYRNFRPELPLLRSDHETDCKMFAQKESFEIKLQDIKLPLEIVDEDNNGGLTFSPDLWVKGAEILESIKKEKLEVSKDTLVHLQNTLKNDWTDQDQEKIWESVHKYKRVSCFYVNCFFFWGSF